MTRILHLADLHLGRSHSYLGDRAGERKRETDGLLGRIVDRVLGDPIEVDAVIIAGDLFESYKPEDRLAGEVIGQLGRLIEAGKTVITLPGNHDELSYGDCVYNKHAGRWPGILVTSPVWTKITTISTADGPCHFYAIAYQAGMTATTLDPSVSIEPDGLHVAVLHAASGLPGKDRSIQTTWDDLGKLGVDYVALGHIHKPDLKKLGCCTAVYPGLIEGGGFADPGCGEIVLVTLSGGAVNVERLPFPVRSIRTEAVDLAGFEDAGALAGHIRAMADPEIILRIELTGAAGFDVSTALLAGELASLFYFLEIEAEYTLMGAAEVEVAAGEETVLGLVLRDLREQEKAAGNDPERMVVRRAINHVWEAFRGGSDHA